MDKGMKAEIRAIIGWDEKSDKGLDKATDELTTLIIKWLEEKKVNVNKVNHDIALIDASRNQLIAELVEEVR